MTTDGTESLSAAPRWRQDDRRRANRALLDALEAVWSLCPDQRFGQLVMNLSREPGGFADTWEWKHGAWYDALTKLAGQLESQRIRNGE